MYKKLLLIVSISLFYRAVSQNEVLEISIHYESTSYESKESFTISNDKTGELVIFIEDYLKTKAILLDSNLRIVAEIETVNLPSTFKTFLGHQINPDGTYSILYTNNSGKKFGEINLNFESREFTIKTLEFKLKQEAYVESISFKDVCYLMTVTKNSNDVHFYVFNGDTFLKRKTISFDFLESVSENNFKKKAYHFLISKNLESTRSLMKMVQEIPNAIEATSAPNKLYVINSQFIFTFNNSPYVTKVAIVSLETFQMEFHRFLLPSIPDNTTSVNYNSYLFENKIFQIKSSSNSLKFTIQDLQSKALLKELTLNKEDSITFKNTPIIQEQSSLFAKDQLTREMEKTSKFLRKLCNGDVGLAVYKQNDTYKITIGSTLEIVGGNSVMPMGGFGNVSFGGFTPINATFNPVFFAYNGYSTSKSVHIDCLFDNEFNHVKGPISSNVFDKMKIFEDEYSEKSKTTTGNIRIDKQRLKNVFWFNGKLYFSYISQRSKNYHMVEFED